MPASGRMLKLRQRDDALARGIDLIEWTFDPLEIKNAYFNMERLGAIVRRYVRNQYGTTSSHLHGGLPTDRCIAEWWIDSRPRRSDLTGEPSDTPAIVHAHRRARRHRRDPTGRSAARARDSGSDRATSFETAFAQRAGGHRLRADAEDGTYLLGKWP